MKAKKPNRAARMEKKKFHADTFNLGFITGYEAAMKELKVQAEKQPNENGIGKRHYNLD